MFIFSWVHIKSHDAQSYEDSEAFVRRIAKRGGFGMSLEDRGPVETEIRMKLVKKLDPIYLDVINDSYLHSVPPGSETHFKVIIVSEMFSGKPLIEMHRLVNNALREELQKGVHSVSINARTPEDWRKNKYLTPAVPCRGGFGK